MCLLIDNINGLDFTLYKVDLYCTVIIQYLSAILHCSGKNAYREVILCLYFAKIVIAGVAQYACMVVAHAAKINCHGDIKRMHP